MISVLKFRYFFTSVFIIIGAILWASYPRYYQFSGSTFGTYYNVIVVGPKYAINKESLEKNIQHRLSELDKIFSTYRSDSELMKLNRVLVDQTIEVNDELVYLINVSHELKEKIGSVWDPTITPISKKYGFDTVVGITGSVIGLEHLDVLSHNKVRKKASIVIDFSSIAKGYAVDQLSELVNNLNIKGSYIDIGGEIRTSGKKAANEPWGIGIQSPLNSNELTKVLYTNDIAIATSGNYLNYIEKNDRKIGHILDPRTKSPIHHELLSVSIIATNCTEADALATGIYVMGIDDAKEWLDKNNEYPALLIYKDDDQLVTIMMNGFDQYLNP